MSIAPAGAVWTRWGSSICSATPGMSRCSTTWASRSNGCRRPIRPGPCVGRLTGAAAEACGLPLGLPVVAGVGDGQAGGLGAGVVGPGQTYLNLGTAVITGTYADRYLTDRAFRTMYGAVPGSYSLETVLLGGTYTVTWFIDTFMGARGDEAARLLDRFDRSLDRTPVGAEGLMLVPYWNSAMSPYWDARASGMVVGWRGVHTPEHLYRAILEGIAFEARLHTEGVEAALNRPVLRYTVMGGGARSERWRQIIADVTGKPVGLSDHDRSSGSRCRNPGCRRNRPLCRCASSRVSYGTRHRRGHDARSWTPLVLYSALRRYLPVPVSFRSFLSRSFNHPYHKPGGTR